jgi:hypothetical protein
MKAFINATREAICCNNWYAALALALTMPDICGRLEDPASSSTHRSKRWFNTYLLDRYQMNYAGEDAPRTFLNAEDFYALRCAYLHQGEFDVLDQRVRTTLTNFRFSAPLPGMLIHCNLINHTLQLQVDIFCEQICAGVEQWQQDVSGNAVVQIRMARLGEIVTTPWP